MPPPQLSALGEHDLVRLLGPPLPAAAAGRIMVTGHLVANKETLWHNRSAVSGGDWAR